MKKEKKIYRDPNHEYKDIAEFIKGLYQIRKKIREFGSMEKVVNCICEAEAYFFPKFLRFLSLKKNEVYLKALGEYYIWKLFQHDDLEAFEAFVEKTEKRRIEPEYYI